MEAYYRPYLEIATRTGHGFVLDTPTWRASLDWGAQLGYDAEQLEAVNRSAVEFVSSLGREYPIPIVVNGVIGPRGDGYVVDNAMTASEARRFHALQARAFATAGADMITAVTMNDVGEAAGVVQAAADAGLPVAVSFTVETDGRLPSGVALADAVEAVDWHTDGYAAYFMVNCAHPTHFERVLTAGSLPRRVRGIRANASRASHAELDAATELDRGNPQELAADYRRLDGILDGLAVVGGCCGTDHQHIERIAESLTGVSP